mgnify:CR=1 FL=1
MLEERIMKQKQPACTKGESRMDSDTRDIEVMKRVADALPYMTEGKKGELIGYGKAMVDLNRRQSDGQEDDRKEVD